MTAWFEQRPGSDVSLLALYDAVEAAEELDLREQADFESAWSGFWRLDDEGFVSWRTWDEMVAGVDAVADDEPEEEHADAEDERPSMSQAIGIIEHLLGGHTLP